MRGELGESSAPRWFHWASLVAVAVMMIMLGALEVMQGADPGSRFFAVDTIVVRVFGVGLLLCAFSLPLLHDRAFVASIAMLWLTLGENLVTYRFEAAALNDTLLLLVSLAIVLGVPIYILGDLRRVFRGYRERERLAAPEE